MKPETEPQDPIAMAAEIDVQIQALPVQNTPNVRAVRRRYSQHLKTASPVFVLELAKESLSQYGYRAVAYELIRNHKETFSSLDVAELEGLGRGIDSWWAVDSFAVILAGPAWLNGQISDEAIHGWAGSDDRWWRRPLWSAQ